MRAVITSSLTFLSLFSVGFLYVNLRGISDWLMPFLIVALIASAAFNTHSIHHLNHKTKLLNTRPLLKNIFIGWIGVVLFFFVSFFLIRLAEDCAAFAWKKSGEPLNDAGSYYDLYPDDSGMSHWRVSLIRIYTMLAYTCFIWLPISALFSVIGHYINKPKNSTRNETTYA